MPDGLSFYNEETGTVDIILDSHTTLRLSCKKFFNAISSAPENYERIVSLAKENPRLFAEMALDQWLESYLDSSF